MWEDWNQDKGIEEGNICSLGDEQDSTRQGRKHTENSYIFNSIIYEGEKMRVKEGMCCN